MGFAHEPDLHDDVIKWKIFPRYWPFVRGIHRSPVNSPHKGQWRGALMFSLICVWINGWVNKREAGDFRRHCTHYDVIIMLCQLDRLFRITTKTWLLGITCQFWCESTSHRWHFLVMTNSPLRPVLDPGIIFPVTQIQVLTVTPRILF